MNRLSRQTRLAEVGTEGQARIARAKVRARARATLLAGEIERLYLARAGVGSIEDAAEGESSPAFPMRAWALDPSAREVALGAWNALDAIRGALKAERS